MILELDAKLSKQIDLIVHHPDFQKLNRPWRGLKFVVDRTTSARTSNSKCSTSPKKT